MKLLSLAAALLITAAAQAQAPTAKDPQGYWVVEDNVSTPKKATVIYYNNDHQVVHRENLEGRRIKPWKPRVSKRLDANLRLQLDAWAARTKKESTLAARQ